ncbi:thioredoxin-like protein; 49720-48645 [Arabidopsis thaliana]|nr:thioredoxin-like protein; 49720-48645 [Arabidopsis thaliana]
MASISLSSSTVPSLNSKESSGVSAFASRSISAVKFQFPVRRIEAKKQTFDSFEDLLVNSDKPVLVDYYATWCGPCQFMVPILNEVSETLKDKIQVVKIDTEKYPSIANKYKIEALPTFILFKDGEPCDRFEGALTAKQLIQRIEDSLKVKP